MTNISNVSLGKVLMILCCIASVPCQGQICKYTAEDAEVQKKKAKRILNTRNKHRKKLCVFADRNKDFCQNPEFANFCPGQCGIIDPDLGITSVFICTDTIGFVNDYKTNKCKDYTPHMNECKNDSNIMEKCPKACNVMHCKPTCRGYKKHIKMQIDAGEALQRQYTEAIDGICGIVTKHSIYCKKTLIQNYCPDQCEKRPSTAPSQTPSDFPSHDPTRSPSVIPSVLPSDVPSVSQIQIRPL